MKYLTTTTVIALMFIIIGSYFTGSFLLRYLNLEQLKSHGIEIQANITNKSIEYDAEKKTSAAYLVQYKYITNKDTITSEQMVNESYYNSVDSGNSVVVIYLSEDQNQSCIKDQFQLATSLKGLIFSGIVTIIALIVLIVGLITKSKSLKNTDNK